MHFDPKTKIYVITADQFNAFALPDNTIFVLNKTLKDINSSSELAALFAHEYSHIKYRHGMKTVSTVLFRELIAELFSDKNKSDNFIRTANQLLILENSREFETQADTFGLQLLREHHINQNGMVDLFNTILKLPEQSENETPTFLQTHPETSDRLEKAEEIIKTNPAVSKTNSKLELIFNEIKEQEAEGDRDISF